MKQMECSSRGSKFDGLCIQRYCSAYSGCNAWLFEYLTVALLSAKNTKLRQQFRPAHQQNIGKTLLGLMT